MEVQVLNHLGQGLIWCSPFDMKTIKTMFRARYNTSPDKLSELRVTKVYIQGETVDIKEVSLVQFKSFVSICGDKSLSGKDILAFFWGKENRGNLGRISETFFYDNAEDYLDSQLANPSAGLFQAPNGVIVENLDF